MARKRSITRRRTGPRSVRIRQYGSGLQLFKAQPLQRGYGFGGLFRGLLKSIAPMAKRGLLSAGKAALNAGARALGDIRDNNTSVKQALKRQAIETFKPSTTTTTTTTPINRGVRKRKASTQPRQTKRKVPRVTSAAAAAAARRTTKKKNNTKKKGIPNDAPRLPRQ